MGWAGKFGGQKTHDPPPPFGMKLSEPILNEGRKSHDRLPITLDIFGYIIQQNRILCMNCGIIYVLRQKRYRLPFRKRAVNLRKTRHGVHVSENPLFPIVLLSGNSSIRMKLFHYPVVSHYGERRIRFLELTGRLAHGECLVCQCSRIFSGCVHPGLKIENRHFLLFSRTARFIT